MTTLPAFETGDFAADRELLGGIAFDSVAVAKARAMAVRAGLALVDCSNWDADALLAFLTASGISTGGSGGTGDTSSALNAISWGTLAGKAIYPIKSFAPYGVVTTANCNWVFQKALDSGAQFLAPPAAFSASGTPQPWKIEHLEWSPWSQMRGFPGLTYLQQIAGTRMTAITFRPGTERDMGSMVMWGFVLDMNRDLQTLAANYAIALRAHTSTTYTSATPFSLDDPYWRVGEILVCNSANTAFKLQARFGGSVFGDLFGHSIGSTKTYAGNDAICFDLEGYDGKWPVLDSGNTAGPGTVIRPTNGATNIIDLLKDWFSNFDQEPGGSTVTAKGTRYAFEDYGNNNVVNVVTQDNQGGGALIAATGGQYTMLHDGINDSFRGDDASYITFDGSSNPQQGNRVVMNCSEQNTMRAPTVVKWLNGADRNELYTTNRTSTKGVPNLLRSISLGAQAHNVFVYNGMNVHGR